MRDLLAASESRLRRRYLELIRWLREHNTLDAVAAAISAGHVQDAIAGLEEAAHAFAMEVNHVYAVAAEDEAKVASLQLRTRVTYDAVNEEAVRAARENAYQLVREIVQEQRDLIRRVETEGITQGLNPIEVARDLRASIGLTQKQWTYIDNYRRELQRGDPAALGRELTDGRHDRTVRAAIEGRRAPLAPAEIDRMVQRYADNWVVYRSEVIARTEGLRAAHQGMMRTWDQVIERGKISAADLYGTWLHTPSPKQRDFHAEMNEQEQPYGQPFVSGLGNFLRYPCDPVASAEETANCRCGMTVRVRSQFARGAEQWEAEDEARDEGALPRSSRDLRIPEGEDWQIVRGVYPAELEGRVYALPGGVQEGRIATQERLFREGRTPGPIQVVMDRDGDMEFVNGRHRYLAARRLGQPIDIMVSDTTSDLSEQVAAGTLVPVDAR